MLNKLKDILSYTPKISEQGTHTLWDDEHISKGMLAAHLDELQHLATRELPFVKASVKWIAEKANLQDGKKLLDLGCGPGIYAQLFIASGCHVTGIDISQRSIAYAKEKAQGNVHLSYHCMNYLDMDDSNEFDVITMIYCDFGVLSQSQRRVLLKKIWKALKEGGIFLFDCFTHHQYINFKQENSFHYEDKGYWSETPYLCMQRTIAYLDSYDYLEQYILVQDDGIRQYHVWNHAFCEGELQDLLQAAGFEKPEIYQDVAGTPYTGDSKTICVVAKKKGD